jgi:hypothetical protein
MGRKPNLQNKVLPAEEPEAQRRGGRQLQEARLEVLPAQDRALPDRTLPQLDDAPAYPVMLVVPVPDTDPGAPLQGVP